MGVASCSLHLGVAQQLTYHRKTFGKRLRTRSKGVTEVEKKDPIETRALAHPVPEAVGVVVPVPLFPPRKHPGIERAYDMLDGKETAKRLWIP